MGELRIKACVEAWPECVSGDYNPLCCRFPKSCSCDIYNDGVDPALLEGPPVEHHVGTLDLSGEGNGPASVVSDEIVDKATGVYGGPSGRMRSALEAAYPAIRQQVAEEIAVAIAELEGYDGNCDCQDCVSTARLVEVAREIGAGVARGTADGFGS